MILFTADWHLKLGQKNVPLEWAEARYKSFFNQISELERQCTMHIIGGDLFDRLPSMEELRLYFSFIRKVSIPTLIYDGNHEATKKNKTFFTHLKQVSRDINPLINIVDISYIDDGLGYGVLPYAELHRKNALAHFNKNKPVFAGDLHAHSNTQNNIVYPGSPMTTSFHRNEVETGYLLIDSKDWSWTWYKFDLPQLLRKTVSSPEEMVPTDYHHTIYELEGDIQDLSKVKNSELLDKKVVRRSSEATLLLSKEMSIAEELSEYLEYILELPKNKISSILGTYNDYSKTSAME